MSKLALTPWARKALTAADVATIHELAPATATVSIVGRPWTCRISVGGVLVGDSFHRLTPMDAFYAAMHEIRERMA